MTACSIASASAHPIAILVCRETAVYFRLDRAEGNENVTVLLSPTTVYGSTVTLGVPFFLLIVCWLACYTLSRKKYKKIIGSTWGHNLTGEF